MEIEYPDKSIHKVDCYRFCKSRLSDGEEIYFIEYKDFTGKSNGEFVDSYGIIKQSNGKWYKTERKIDYYTLSNHVVEEIDPKILGNHIGFRNNSYVQSQNNSFIHIQRDSEDKNLELQTQTEPKRDEIPPKYRNDGNMNVYNPMGIKIDDEYELQTQTEPKRDEIPPKYRNDGNMSVYNPMGIKIDDEYELQTQTEPKRDEIPPKYRNDGNININNSMGIKAEEYELQTQTEPKRDEITPKNIMQENKIVYIVLPTIDGKEEKLDINKIHSQHQLLSFTPTEEIVKMKYNYKPYNYANEFLCYNSCKVPTEISYQITNYLDQMARQDNIDINQISDLIIKGYNFQFIHSDNHKYSCGMTSDKIYLPPKMNCEINKKDMFQRFMSSSAAGTIHNEKNNTFEINGPKLKDSVKAELFSLLMTNSKIKALVEDHKMKDITTIPRDSYELDEVTAEIMKQNFILGLQINMSPEEREDFRQKTKDINNLEDLRSFITKYGINISQELPNNQLDTVMENSSPKR